MTPTIPKSVLRQPAPAPPLIADQLGPAVPKSVLRRPDPQDPFASFAADDLGSIGLMFKHGFDPFVAREHGLSCLMHAASRGNSASVHLTLSLCSDPQSLASLKSDSGLDAFDMAAACGSVSCLWELERHLPSAHRTSINRCFVWHAVDAHRANPTLADAWMAHLLSTPSRIQPMDVAQALLLAREIGIPRAIARLEDFLANRTP